jgi:Major Facilitator Superfamily
VPGHWTSQRKPLDLPGIVLVSAGLFALSFGLLEGQRFGWGTIAGPLSIPLVLAAGVVLLVLFALQQRRSRNALIPVALLAYRNFTAANAVVATVTFALAGSLLLLTLYLQTALGLPPLRAGLTIAPLSAAFGVVGIVVGRRSTAENSRSLLVRGLVVYAVGLGATAVAIRPGASALALLGPMLVCGLGLGCVFAPMSNLALGQLDRTLAGAASGVYNTTRQVGNVLGNAVVGALLQAVLAGRVAAAGRAGVGQLPPSARGPFTRGVGHLASGGLDSVNANRIDPPAGLSARAAQQFHHLGDAAFSHGLAEALRLSMLAPIAALGCAALCCLGLRRAGRPAASDGPPEGGQAPVVANTPRPRVS